MKSINEYINEHTCPDYYSCDYSMITESLNLGTVLGSIQFAWMLVGLAFKFAQTNNELQFLNNAPKPIRDWVKPKLASIFNTLNSEKYRDLYEFINLKVIPQLNVNTLNPKNISANIYKILGVIANPSNVAHVERILKICNEA